MRETESSRNLYEVAEPQSGFFTTKQAIEAVYDESKHGYHVRAGNWIREYRGMTAMPDLTPRTLAAELNRATGENTGFCTPPACN